MVCSSSTSPGADRTSEPVRVRGDLDGDADATPTRRSRCPTSPPTRPPRSVRRPTRVPRLDRARPPTRRRASGPRTCPSPRCTTCRPRSSSTGTRTSASAPRARPRRCCAAGRPTIGGRIPVNPSGGLACFGEAVPAQALAQVCELTWQLRGQAGDRQVEGARVGITPTRGCSATARPSSCRRSDAWTSTWTDRARTVVPGRGPGVAGRARRRVAGPQRRRRTRATRERASRSTSSGSASSSTPAGRSSRGPRTYGGRDASLWEWLIFEEEYYRAGCPQRVTQNGIFLLAPTVFEFGDARSSRTTSSRAWRPPRTCGARAGPSRTPARDLAGISSRAVRDVDGGWRLDGQKTWTTRGAFCTWLFGLFRTDPAASATGA